MKQLAKVLASFSLAATMCLGVGFAADSPHPGEHGTVDKAMVSEETDKAYDEKPNMGTKFNLYLAPDIPETVPPIKKDVPKMGYRHSSRIPAPGPAGSGWLLSCERWRGCCLQGWTP